MLLIVAFALWFAVVLAYSSGAWGLALYRLVVDGGVLALWLAAAAGIGTSLLPLFRAVDSDQDSGLLRVATAVALGLGVLSLAILGLGLAGWLTPVSAMTVIAVGIVAGGIRLAKNLALPISAVFDRDVAQPPSAVFDRRSKSTGRLPRDVGTQPGAAVPHIEWALLIAVPFAGLMTAAAMLPPYLLWTPEEPHGYDVVEYHLQVPREWYEAGRIAPLNHNVFSFFPFNVEMHYLLAMHLRGGPWSGMYLAQFMHAAFVVLAVLAACGFAPRGAPAVASALALAATPWLTQLGAIAYDEGGLLLFGTLAIGWALRAACDRDQRIRRLALAGTMAGFACGSKLTAVPEVLVATAVVLAAFLFVLPRARKESLLQRTSGVLVFTLAGLLCFAPWLIRTWAWSGNPVFPELPSVLGRGHFSQVQVERWERAHSPRPDQRSLPARLSAGWTDVLASWQFGFLLIPAALAAMIVDFRNPDVWFLGAMLFLLAVFWVGFTHLQGRFFILAAPICAMLIARLSWGVLPVLAIQAVIAFILLNTHFLTPLRRSFIPLVLGTEDLSWLTPPAMRPVPANEPLTLVGDAKAFVYQRPMSLLSYRTIFDVDTSRARDILEAWAGATLDLKQRWLLIDPTELERFERTYQPLPPLPADVAAHREPFLIRR